MSLAHRLLRVLLILAIGVNAWATPRHAGAAMHAGDAGDHAAVIADDGHEGCAGMDAEPAPAPEPDCCAGDSCQCDCTQAFTVAPGLQAPARPLPARLQDSPPVDALTDTRLARLNRPPIG